MKIVPFLSLAGEAIGGKGELAMMESIPEVGLVLAEWKILVLSFPIFGAGEDGGTEFNPNKNQNISKFLHRMINIGSLQNKHKRI